MAMRLRKSVWALQDWDDTLVWYAKAVAEMRRLPATDPRSWFYQAGIHGYSANLPAWQLGQPLPPLAERREFWAQCQHGSWYFLPWHRIYLAHFEQIVGAVVKRLQGPDDWALLYWDYSAPDPRSRTLPPAFKDAVAPGIGANPLQMERDLGTSLAALPEQDVELSAMAEPDYTNTLGGTSGFGGGVTGFAHHGQLPGLLEMVPHNVIHDDIGGVMRFPASAALDPLFWLHHCNIDRLWDLWLRSDAAHSNPNDARWQGMKFAFHDSAGHPVAAKVADYIDTTQILGGYAYEDATAGGAAPAALDELSGGAAMGRLRQPELAGAVVGPIVLGSSALSLSVPIEAPIVPLSVGGVDEPVETFLNFENVIGSGAPPVFDVYLNLPDGADPKQHAALRAGVIAPFGVEESTAQTRTGGVRYVVPVTQVVDQLQRSNVWDPDRMKVTLVPRRALRDGDDLTIGRVSLFFQ
jgi:tyrosinase